MNYSTKGWLIVGAVVGAIEVKAPPGQTLSEGVDEGLKHPLGKILIPFFVLQCAAHLLNRLHPKVDLIHIVFQLARAMRNQRDTGNMIEVIS